MDLWKPCSPATSLSALLYNSPSLVVLQHVVTHLPLHSGLCVYALPASSAPLYGCLERTALLSLWQRSASAPSLADVMLLQPRRHTSRQADGQTDRQTNKKTGCIYSLSAYASSQQAAWPDTPSRQAHPEHVVFIMWHPQVCILQVQAFK